MFEALYRSWSHSAGATLSLCFLAQVRLDSLLQHMLRGHSIEAVRQPFEFSLGQQGSSKTSGCSCCCAQAYQHASDLIGVFREVRMGVETLVQIDRLVQILETPVFTSLRLHLLQPSQYPSLLR